MGAKKKKILDFALLLAMGIAAFAGACGGLTGDAKDHVEIGDSECVVCHRDDYANTTKPPHPGMFSEKCADCHTETAWVPAKFQHPFPLAGAHA